MAKKAKKNVELYSKEELAIAKWQFRRYNDLCKSIWIHEQRGQGLNHDTDLATDFQTSDDSEDYADNLKLKGRLEYVRDQYLTVSWKKKVWALAIGERKLLDFEDCDQIYIKQEYRNMLEGLCREMGIGTTRNIRNK